MAAGDAVQADSLFEAGSRSFGDGRYGPALDQLHAAFRMHQQLGNAEREALTAAKVAALYAEIGQAAEAFAWASRAVSRRRSPAALYQMAVELDRGARRTEALQFLDEALVRADSIDWQALILARRAMIRYWRSVDPDQRTAANERPDRDLTRAISLAQSGVTPRTSAEVWYTAGLIHLQRGNFSAAIRDFSRALEHARRARHLRSESRTLSALGRAHDGLRQFRRAAACFRAAVDCLEMERRQIPEPYRAGFSALKDDYYRHWIDALYALHRQSPGAGHEGEAVQAAERMRQAADPRRLSPTRLVPKAIQRLLDPDAALLYYTPGELDLYALAVTPNRVRFVRTGEKTEVLMLAERCREALQRHQANDPEISLLSLRLLERIATVLPAKRLLIVSFAETAAVPFAALRTPGPGTRLGLDREIVHLPHAALLPEVAVRPTPARRGVTVIADPVFSADDARVPRRAPVQGRAFAAGATFARLPFSRREAYDVASFVPAGGIRVALDFEATPAEVLASASRGDSVLHVATHAVQHPEPGLILSQVDRDGRPVDGRLRLADLAALRFAGSPLVVLSGCVTGPAAHGSGMHGWSLARAFRAAGARAVISSLWRVEDEVAAAFMREFYRELLREQRSPASALHAARVAMARSARWKHPHDWAGFLLEGDWR